MSKSLSTPGVYINEKNEFPNSIVAVETAIPVFIGYTEIALRDGKSLVRQATCIRSFAEYTDLFGTGFKAKYTLSDAADTESDAILINGVHKVLSIADNQTFYLYNAVRLFYANGGGTLYIFSLATYGDKPEGFAINVADFMGSDGITGAIDQLVTAPEPTLIVLPDAIALGEECYNTVYTAVLQHCANVQSRFAIFDLVKQTAPLTTNEIVANFRDQIGAEFLNYGAAYYPWLKTTIVQPEEIDFENFDESVDLANILPEDAAKALIASFKALTAPTKTNRKDLHFSLIAKSNTYADLLNKLRNLENELPPSGAIAGIYASVDNSRGVWKAPANISLSMVEAPSINISDAAQAELNIDAMSGKSINIIRSFAGAGTLVWGARTLDGNSLDWRYINVRRTMIMIEQSIKLACRSYVFEPNDANTWVTVKSMITSFLFNLWKQGALTGSVPEESFNVQVGLGSTMTPQDILDGVMNVYVQLAIVRPAEFITITFQQQMQQS